MQTLLYAYQGKIILMLTIATHMKWWSVYIRGGWIQEEKEGGIKSSPRGIRTSKKLQKNSEEHKSQPVIVSTNVFNSLDQETTIEGLNIICLTYSICSLLQKTNLQKIHKTLPNSKKRTGQF